MSDLNCPYCDAELEVCHDDGQNYEEGVKHQMDCGKCGKRFVFETSISFYYEPEKADCINDEAEHDWKPTHTFPTEYTKMECKVCEAQRPMSIEERETMSAIWRERNLGGSVR